jgi:hypothetical protein
MVSADVLPHKSYCTYSIGGLTAIEYLTQNPVTARSWRFKSSLRYLFFSIGLLSPVLSGSDGAVFLPKRDSRAKPRRLWCQHPADGRRGRRLGVTSFFCGWSSAVIPRSAPSQNKVNAVFRVEAAADSSLLGEVGRRTIIASRCRF